MQREISARRLARAPADQIIFNPEAQDARPVVGRLVARGLSDELHDRHYLVIDGTDGHAQYVEIGRGGTSNQSARGPTFALYRVPGPQIS